MTLYIVINKRTRELSPAHGYHEAKEIAQRDAKKTKQTQMIFRQVDEVVVTEFSVDIPSKTKSKKVTTKQVLAKKRK